jgi:hypothetical protein
MRYIKLFEQFVEGLNEEINEALNPAKAQKLIQATANDEFHYSGYLGDEPAQMVFKAAAGASKLPMKYSVYFDGQSIIMGDKTVATWKKGMTVGQVFQLYVKVAQAAMQAAQADSAK